MLGVEPRTLQDGRPCYLGNRVPTVLLWGRASNSCSSIFSAEYVERLRATEKMKTRDLHREGANFESIYICPSTFACAQLATGAACRLVEAVLSGEVRPSVFSACRCSLVEEMRS